MTKKQHRWYLREWSAAWRAHWCGVKGGEALARRDRPPSHEVRDRVIAIARAYAAKSGGALSPDHLRHACHILAIGKDVGSMALTNKQIDLVVAVFRQLAGIDLAAMMRTGAAEAEAVRRAQAKEAGKAAKADDLPAGDSDRARTLWAIEHVDLPPSYVDAICRDKFGTAAYRTLPDEQLHQLHITLKMRHAARAIAGTKRINVAKTL